MPRLRRVDPAGPGLTRRRAGKGWVYLDGGRRITDPATLERIAGLVIPPAWQEVWISPVAVGHIQATGVDARGRTQYRYHDAWRIRRDQEKFDHMLVFARSLPGLRAKICDHLAAPSSSGINLGCAQVLSCATRLLDLGFFRIGSDAYAEENQTYGLASMLKRHAHVHGDTVTFDFVAKGSKRRLQSIVDSDVARVIAALKARRGGGSDLLAWRRQVGRTVEWVDVRSDDINSFVRQQAGVDCSAKDFRTWNATVLAAVALAVSSNAASPTARKRCVALAMKDVAHYLGNTPAVVRRSYVDPRVVDRYHHGETVASALASLGEGVEFGHPSTQGAVEEAVLDLLDDAPPAAVDAA